MSERWQVFFYGFYEVSTMGNIRRAKPGISTFVGRPVQPVTGPGGYPQVQLSGDGHKRRAYVHHIVAEVFIGPRIKGRIINHKNMVRTDNRRANLEYVSARENVAHALANGTRRRGPAMPPRPLKGPQVGDAHWSRRMPDRIARGERMGTSKLTVADVRHIRRLRTKGMTMHEIGEVKGVSQSQVCRILAGTRWGHVK